MPPDRGVIIAPVRSTLASRGRNSESGLISVSAVLGIAFLALIVYLLLAALDADTDYYGSVAIPSENVAIELPKGETDLYISEKGDPDKLGDLDVPADLTFTFTPPDGGDPVRVDDREADTEDTDGGVTKEIAALQVPQEGTYLVSVSSNSAGTLSQPRLTFGLSPLGAVTHRFEDVVDELKGPTGIIVLIALGALMLAPRISRAMER